MSTDSEETIMTWRNHFDTLLNPNSTESSCTQSWDNCPSIDDDDALNRPIELEEVQQAIAQLQENKAPGPYNICPSIILKMSE